jgi:Putative transposase
VKALSKVFRGKFLSGLKHLYQTGQLCLAGALKPLTNRKTFDQFLRTLHQQDWVVHAKTPSVDRSMFCITWLAIRTG